MSTSEEETQKSTFVKFGESAIFNKNQIESIQCSDDKCEVKMINNPTVHHIDDRKSVKDIKKFIDQQK